MADAVTMDKIVSLCKRRGFVFPSSEIYGGLGSSYDYGHYGVLLKDNIKQRWLAAMVQERDDIVALDSSIILHPEVWEASGHVGGFTDPLSTAGSARSASAPIISRMPSAASARASGPARHPTATSPRPATSTSCSRRAWAPSRRPACRSTSGPRRRRASSSTSRTWPRSRGASRRSASPRSGKSFRNEITPGNFIFRTLEFEQMEMEFFVPPADAEEWYRYWVDERFAWHLRYGIRESNLRVRPHDADELSHYSSGTSDIEYLFPIGWSELEGIANRGDFDLTAHTECLGHEARMGRAGREPLHPARDRAGARRQPVDARIPRRRLRRGGRGRPRSHRAAAPSSARAGESRRPAADRQERGHGGQGAQALRGARAR